MNSSLKSQIKALIFSHLSRHSRDLIFQTLRRSKTEEHLLGINFVIDTTCGQNTKMITKKINSLAGTRSLRYKCNHTDFMVVGPAYLKSTDRLHNFHSQDTFIGSHSTQADFLQNLQLFLEQEAQWVKKKVDEYLKCNGGAKGAVLETALDEALEECFGHDVNIAS